MKILIKKFSLIFSFFHSFILEAESESHGFIKTGVDLIFSNLKKGDSRKDVLKKMPILAMYKSMKNVKIIWLNVPIRLTVFVMKLLRN